MDCAYCEQPLICEDCGADFVAKDPRVYESLSRGDEAVTCPACESILVCHWCKTPYDGLPGDSVNE